MTDKLPETDWYWEVTISSSQRRFDLLSCCLFENGASGIEELEENGDARMDRVFFPASVPDPASVINCIQNQFQVLDKIEIIDVHKKPLLDWQSGWRSFFKPIAIGSSFLIRPPWESSLPERKEIVIKPGQGFGTGYHESTHLALLLLEWTFKQNPVQTVTDVGTGSGILAIAALLLGAQRVVAIDLDRDALAEVPKNLILSGLQPSSVELLQCGPGALREPTELVIANIEGHILERLVDELLRLVSTGGRLVLSGVLTDRQESLLAAYGVWFEQVHTLQLNEWSGFVLQKHR